jgi:ATP-dependent DNA ligase
VLEELNLRGSHWDTAMSFEDGHRLFKTVCEIGLEGVVAKKLWQRYRPGERIWVKVKNRDYWRYGLEREAAIRSGRRIAI